MSCDSDMCVCICVSVCLSLSLSLLHRVTLPQLWQGPQKKQPNKMKQMGAYDQSMNVLLMFLDAHSPVSHSPGSAKIE